MSAETVDQAELAREVKGVQWYHTIELPGGIVTPGRWDTRGVAERLPLPRSCEGLRCLDIGTYDGFWAFEMERRGASEVVALDVVDVEQWDWPIPGRKQTLLDWKQGIPSYTGFDVAHRAFGSRVERIELSVYEATPEKLGMFDFILFGDLLPHLRDPVGALTAIRSVCRGQLLSADVVSVTMTLLRPFHPAADLEALRAPFW